ncbi:MAG: hypothetical protein GY826_00405, partial [Fuerstiella sp.]|nr:hypothetical protein [Fuerstiella sp.]
PRLQLIKFNQDHAADLSILLRRDTAYAEAGIRYIQPEIFAEKYNNLGDAPVERDTRKRYHIRDRAAMEFAGGRAPEVNRRTSWMSYSLLDMANEGKRLSPIPFELLRFTVLCRTELRSMPAVWKYFNPVCRLLLTHFMWLLQSMGVITFAPKSTMFTVNWEWITRRTSMVSMAQRTLLEHEDNARFWLSGSDVKRCLLNERSETYCDGAFFLHCLEESGASTDTRKHICGDCQPQWEIDPAELQQWVNANGPEEANMTAHWIPNDVLIQSVSKTYIWTVAQFNGKKKKKVY